jgi:hypothetical protein
MEFKEAKSVAAVRNRMEVDGLKTEEANAVLQVCLDLSCRDGVGRKAQRGLMGKNDKPAWIKMKAVVFWR